MLVLAVNTVTSYLTDKAWNRDLISANYRRKPDADLVSSILCARVQESRLPEPETEHRKYTGKHHNYQGAKGFDPGTRCLPDTRTFENSNPARRGSRIRPNYQTRGYERNCSSVNCNDAPSWQTTVPSTVSAMGLIARTSPPIVTAISAIDDVVLPGVNVPEFKSHEVDRYCLPVDGHGSFCRYVNVVSWLTRCVELVDCS